MQRVHIRKGKKEIPAKRKKRKEVQVHERWTWNHVKQQQHGTTHAHNIAAALLWSSNSHVAHVANRYISANKRIRCGPSVVVCLCCDDHTLQNHLKITRLPSEHFHHTILVPTYQKSSLFCVSHSLTLIFLSSQPSLTH